ncbi:hypothetical protein [Brevibacillus sp. NL20B1]|uniref:hypothetical protein n=1 Tax=Brevibacillus sp. NL20B1 TaxID=2829799 RepID=UPI002013A978|nr:hypothetical protein [Brevibacillus sp. NL20B1]
MMEGTERREEAVLTVFIEYKTDESKRDRCLELLASMAGRMEAMGARQYRHWEGLEQPGLFVEAFDVETVEQYERIKQWRRADQAFCECIAGGAAKLNIWAFCPIDLADKRSKQESDGR